ncbi:MAG: hypothetical protein SW019_13575 [Actinomycetota bacterium]|nr:hypothetical protein [Actinomycetota bacterium]
MDNGGRAGNYLAEWYVPDLAEPTVDDVVARLNLAASMLTGEGTPVRLTMTLSNPSDEVLYGVFDATSAEAVVAACQRAGVPHLRLSTPVVARFAPRPTGCPDDGARADLPPQH